MTIFQDFRRFISRGSVVDMAVGIIVGASFTKIIDVLVNQIVMPPLTALIGGVDFKGFYIELRKEQDGLSAIRIDYGLLIDALINFMIVCISVFVLIKVLHRIYLKSSVLTRQSCPECKMEIPAGAHRCGHCTSILGNEP